MSILPVPAKMLFSDFSFSLEEYSVIRNNKNIMTIKGLPEYDGKSGVAFLLSDNPDIQIGDTLRTEDEKIVVYDISYDKYNGHKELLVINR